MEPKVLDGKQTSKEIVDELKARFEANPTDKKLAIVSVGDDYGSAVYCNMKKKKAEYIGIGCEVFHFEEGVSQEEVENKVQELANDDSFAGIMIQHPLPKYIDEQKCFNLIPPEKDVDGLSATSFGLIAQSRQLFAPATALGIMKLFEKYNINLVGEEVLMIGKSQIVGLPLSVMLMKAGATVTVAHSRTKDLAGMIKNFKIVIVAIGKAELVKADWFTEGQIIVDAGYNEGNVGDVDHLAYEKAEYYTPVPGGVGPMTIASLMSQTAEAIDILNSK
ncbi:MAG: bifunctional 5,10-methylenetetrahydrofolate dehydrogenase/5,10-methenyltetrahydrofolate cyclohydrolase [Clostridia bacterium]|nr:bifunctional 5,10-methylenetetrahydrofolate dehydrogenase/5,10-methenyltetrahydrofolate cyclohydrolase [Clostridia bacterium]MBQ7918294.1 bifunctional 5,10-methylenetetrahydrofolate dehydrogenase/5,10-methenyltetrahydrofolate cyclohydrolase [Clostridia bacterium]